MLVEEEISDVRSNRSRYNLSSSSAKAVRQEKAKVKSEELNPNFLLFTFYFLCRKSISVTENLKSISILTKIASKF